MIVVQDLRDVRWHLGVLLVKIQDGEDMEEIEKFVIELLDAVTKV